MSRPNDVPAANPAPSPGTPEEGWGGGLLRPSQAAPSLTLPRAYTGEGTRRSLAEFDILALATELEAAGHRPVHAENILGAFYRGHGRIDLDRTKLSRGGRAWFDEHTVERVSTLVHRHESTDGTQKLLLEMHDGKRVETVLMPSHRPDRAAGCVSSQVGCAMRCDFCASTRDGLLRNLSAGEIVEQYLALREHAAMLGRRLNSIVFMGMGEPMHNLDAVLAAIGRLTDPKLGAIGKGSVTVSTVGVVPGIRRLASSGAGVHLALSLHAPDDETRGRIIPTNRKWSVAEVLDAAREYQDVTGRITTIEYTLLGGVNDSDEQADLLASLVRGWRVHVNLIPYNPIGPGVSGIVYERPTRERVGAFLDRLRASDVVTHVRATRGDDVAAACGQLRLAVLS